MLMSQEHLVSSSPSKRRWKLNHLSSKDVLTHKSHAGCAFSSENMIICRRERSGEVLRAKSMGMVGQGFRAFGSPVRRNLGLAAGTPRAPRPDPGTAPNPVVSMEMVNSLEAYFPAGSPVVHLLKAPAAFVQSEAMHLSNKGEGEEDKDIVAVEFLLFNSLNLLTLLMSYTGSVSHYMRMRANWSAVFHLIM